MRRDRIDDVGGDDVARKAVHVRTMSHPRRDECDDDAMAIVATTTTSAATNGDDDAPRRRRRRRRWWDIFISMQGGWALSSFVVVRPSSVRSY
jgi:hypothetical protein